MQSGVKVDIKIQSISDIITNSSTEVFTIYDSKDIDTIKGIVNALLAVNGNTTFDDLFDIKMHISDTVYEYLWQDSEELQTEFPDEDKFYDYLDTLSNKELVRFEDMWYDVYRYDGYVSFYDSYTVTLKEGIEETPELKRAIRAIHTFDSIFEHEASYC